MNALSLPSDLGIEHVADLQAALRPHLEDAEPLSLDGIAGEREIGRAHV